MLTKRSHKHTAHPPLIAAPLIAALLLAALLLAGALGGFAPALAAAAQPVAAQPAAAVGVADARPAALAPLRGPVVSFHRAIAVSAHRRVVERRAALRERRERFADLPGGVSRQALEAIASCESGGDPAVVSADGSYRGKYQFDYGTWASVGGEGDPAAAPEQEQDYRAALLYARSGSSPWPVCG